MILNEIESTFNIEEIFFSRTDLKGVIKSGNDVFIRISEYDLDELVNQPHNIIRHPSMPKSVFFLFWSFLKKNEPIAAYVVNKSKTGKFYWVFALALPIDNGYISVRIKPSSQLLPIIKNEYAENKKIEDDSRLSPEELLHKLLQKISLLKFSDYKMFMNYALLQELISRQNLLKRPTAQLNLLNGLDQSCVTLNQESEIIFNVFKESQYYPLNLEIAIANAGDEGNSIAVVAIEYKKIIDEIKNQIFSYKNKLDNVFTNIRNVQFLMATSFIMSNLMTYLSQKTTQKSIDEQNDSKNLEQLLIKYTNLAQNSLNDSKSILFQFIESISNMKQLLLGLEIVRLTGKIESSRLNFEKEKFSTLINQLQIFQQSILKSLGILEDSTRRLLSSMELIKK